MAEELDRTALDRLAELAGIRLDGPGVDPDRLSADLRRILDHVETLMEADTSGVREPLRLPDGPVRPRDSELGPDPLAPGAPREGAPEWREGFFVVPRLPGVEDE